MDRLKRQINALSANSSLPSQPSQSSFLNNLTNLKISNSDLKYTLEHGPEFLHMLDPRDQILEHEFNFDEQFSKNDIDPDGLFIDSKLYQTILKKMKTFLV